jgi:HEAT repeat protein
MKTTLISLTLLLLVSPSWSAPMPTEDFDGVRMALQLPLPNRLKALAMQGPKTFERLQELAQAKSESLETRWRAITAMGRIEPVRAKPFLEAAMQSPDWSMRNAALVVIQYGERTWAVEWAKKLLDDDALVVRTAAVEAIDKMNAIELEDSLWQKLYSKENFKNGKSLWIRKHIARTLTRFARPGQERSFKQILTDEDTTLHSAAIEALTKLTSRQLTRDEWLVQQL